MSIVVLKLPDVKSGTEERPKECPYCAGETFQRWGRWKDSSSKGRSSTKTIPASRRSNRTGAPHAPAAMASSGDRSIKWRTTRP